MNPWKLLDTEYLVNAPWLKVAKEKCQLPSGKVIDDFYTLWQPDWVLILARTLEGNWVMTEQYRHGTGKIALEFPAGIINKNETAEQAALRELQEECGYGFRTPSEASNQANVDVINCAERKDVNRAEETGENCANGMDANCAKDRDENCAKADTADKIVYLGEFPVNPDRHRGKFHVVFLDGVRRNGSTNFDETEEIESSELSDEELQGKISDGTFNHPLQIAGYFKWKLSQK